MLDCRLERCLDGDDHKIVVGHLVALEPDAEDRRPLLHYRGSYADDVAADETQERADPERRLLQPLDDGEAWLRRRPRFVQRR